MQPGGAVLDVVQCDYCQSGQIMSAAALLKDTPKPTDDDIDAAMSGNVCAHDADPARALRARHPARDPAGADGVLPVRRAAWYPKATATFGEALAAVRRRWWRAATSGTSGRDEDMIKLPRQLVQRLSEAACYAA